LVAQKKILEALHTRKTLRNDRGLTVKIALRERPKMDTKGNLIFFKKNIRTPLFLRRFMLENHKQSFQTHKFSRKAKKRGLSLHKPKIQF